jgi:AhpD family alkylhydroperoxidase
MQKPSHEPEPVGQNHEPTSRGPEPGADDITADGRKLDQQVRSYALLEPDIKSLYMNFYKATYRQSTLDIKTKELIAIAAALTSGCKNCLEGHLKKAKKHGATSSEISECIAITLGVNAATIVDRSDIANANLGGLFGQP